MPYVKNLSFAPYLLLRGKATIIIQLIHNDPLNHVEDSGLGKDSSNKEDTQDCP